MKDEEIIKQILKDTSVEITRIIGKGEVNRVYLLKQSNQKNVIRLNEEIEFKRFKKEECCLKQALRKGIPSPKLKEIGVMEKTAFMILSFVEGKNGNEITENKEKIWWTIGSYAKIINSISTKGFGEIMTSSGDFNDSWERYLNYNIQSLNDNDKLLELETLTKEQSNFAKEKFIELKEKKFSFGLVHGDLSLENVIVGDDKVTLIDWGVSESTIVPHMEIVGLFQNQIQESSFLFENFLQGYGMSRDKYQTLKTEIDSLTLLQAVDKLRWALDKKQDKIEGYSKRVKALLI